MEPARELPRSVLIRDLFVFQLKLWMDGIKDIVLSPVSLGAAVLDVLSGRGRDGYRFYAVLRTAERFDRWLSLYAAAQHAEESDQGLFGASRSGDSTLLGQLEELSGGEREQHPT